MEAVTEKFRQKKKEWPANYPPDMKKSEFLSYLKEYDEIVKHIPKTILEYNNLDEPGSNLSKKNKIKMNGHNSSKNDVDEEEPTPFGNTQRIQKIEQLQKKLTALKGKSLSEVDALKRKGIKNRIRKKLKKEERLKVKMNKNNILKQKDVSNTGKKSDKKHQMKIGKNEETQPQDEVMYSKFEFPDGVDEETSAKKKKGPTDPLRLLQKAEKSRNKLREMETRGRIEKVKEIKEKLAWETAIKKVEGEKIKDDIELLKKSLKKQKNAKNRSKKKWEERENNKNQKMEEAQKKRKTNIQKKKKEKQKKKMKKLVKKGRIIP